MEHVKCNLCKGDSSELVFRAKDLISRRGESFDVVRCKNCGLAYVNPRPAKEEISGYYPHQEYYSFSELERNKTGSLNVFEKIKAQFREIVWDYFYSPGASRAKKALQFLLAHFAKHRFGSAPSFIKKGRILDVGCGDGLFLNSLRERGWEVKGVEVSRPAAEIANKYALDVFNGPLLEAGFEENYFDVVRMWSVLEHLPNPLENLREARRILRKDGVLIVQVPNFSSLAAEIFGSSWTAVDVPRHFYHFTPQTFKSMVSEAGFVIKDFQYCSVGTIPVNIPFCNNYLCYWLSLPLDFLLDLLQAGDCILIFARK